MGYYHAGDYYRGGGYYRAGGLGSLLGGIGRAVGGLGIPGVSTLANIGAGLISPQRPSNIIGPASSVGVASIGSKPTVRVKEPGLGGAVHRLLPGGSSGFLSGRRHMNPGNAKAARRAIRRITSVRKMLMSIERQMPHRPCNRQHAKSGGRR